MGCAFDGPQQKQKQKPKELLAASGMYRYAHYMAACLHRNGRLNRHHMNGKEKDPSERSKERTNPCMRVYA